MSQYLENLEWRYATKKFDPARTLTDAQLDELLEAVRLSASSFGLQPYKILVVKDPALRAQLRAAAWDQTQVTDASHLVIFCSYRTIDEAYVDRYVKEIAAQRGIPEEALQGYRDMMVGSVKNRTPEQLADWMKRQSYIALGFLLSAAAQQHVDACPMEGFDPAKADEILGLEAQNLTAATFCPLGFRAADDATASYKKVRFPRETLVMVR